MIKITFLQAKDSMHLSGHQRSMKDGCDLQFFSAPPKELASQPIPFGTGQAIGTPGG